MNKKTNKTLSVILMLIIVQGNLFSFNHLIPPGEVTELMIRTALATQNNATVARIHEWLKVQSTRYPLVKRFILSIIEGESVLSQTDDWIINSDIDEARLKKLSITLDEQSVSDVEEFLKTEQEKAKNYLIDEENVVVAEFSEQILCIIKRQPMPVSRVKHYKSLPGEGEKSYLPEGPIRDWLFDLSQSKNNYKVALIIIWASQKSNEEEKNITYKIISKLIDSNDQLLLQEIAQYGFLKYHYPRNFLAIIASSSLPLENSINGLSRNNFAHIAATLPKIFNEHGTPTEGKFVEKASISQSGLRPLFISH